MPGSHDAGGPQTHPVTEAANPTVLRGTSLPITANDANLTGSTFTDVRLRAARFVDVDLSEAVIEDANLSGLRVSDADLSAACFTDCTMAGMTIDGIAVADLFAAYRVVGRQG